MKTIVKIGFACLLILASLTACTSVPSYGSGPVEPGQTQMRSQGQNNSVPEPGQTEMRRQDGN